MQAHGPKLSALEQEHARLHAGNSLVLQVSAWVCRDRNAYLLVPESLLFKVLGDSARAVFVLCPVCVCVCGGSVQRHGSAKAFVSTV